MERPIEEEIFLIALEEFILKYGGKPNMPLIYAVVGKLVELNHSNVPPPSILGVGGGDVGVMLDNITNDNPRARLIVFVQCALVRLMREHNIELSELCESDRVWIMKRAIQIPNLMLSISDKDPQLDILREAMEKISAKLEKIRWAHPG